MKRYLQAGTIVFFFAAGTYFIYAPAHPQPEQKKAVDTPNAPASLDAGAIYPLNEETDNEPIPALTVSSALVKSADSTRTLYELNADQHWPLASLTKLMNAVVALENLPQTEERDNLIRRMMVISDNSAADALANMLGTEQYIALMNAKAQTLNMPQTGFSDPSGLSYLNQSTVRDIDKLVTYIIIRHPEILSWSRLQSIRVDGVERHNIDELSGKPNFIGGKTGFTDEANGNLVTVWDTAAGPVTIITLGSPTRESRFTDTEILLTWATRHFKP